MVIVIELLRWIFIICSSLVFVSFAYVGSIGLRPGQGEDVPHGLLEWILAIPRHVLLVPGLLPLIFAVAWALRSHSLRQFGQGALVLLGLLAFHYYLVALAIHDRGYLWIQAIEFVLFGLAMWFLLKSPRGIA